MTTKLPINPYNGKPILLCPSKYLRELPTISADNFWDYCYDYENEMLRNDFGSDITRNVDKKTIVNFAKRQPNIRKAFIEYIEHKQSLPYNQLNDKSGLVKWYYLTSSYCQQNPFGLNFKSYSDFQNFVSDLLKIFRNYVENNGGWQLLWNDNGIAKRESAAQRLFLGIIMQYCRANNIDISKEVNIGRGPVDFKVSQGYKFRALIELKLAKNGKFWSGLKKQLTKYLEAEDIQVGFFVVIIYTEKDLEKLKNIQETVAEINEATNYSISVFSIDARCNPSSASNL